MKTKLIIASAILFATSATSAFASADWIGYSAINVNGTWYYAGTNPITQQDDYKWYPEGGAFQSSNDNINLGELSTLHIGGQCQIYDGGDYHDWQGGTINMMYYKIDNGNEQSISLTYDGYNYGEEKNHMHFQSGGANFVGTAIDISNFEAGSVHTLSVRFQCDDAKDPSNNYYVARFKIKAPTSISNASDIIVDEDTPVDVQINGLTLYKDGYWNTICLPFTLTKGDVQMSELSGAEIRKLENGSVSGSTLTLNFSSSLNPANGTDVLIEAGKPYIIKWSGGTNIEDPVFTNVKVSTSQASSVEGDGVTFKGTFGQITCSSTDNYLLVGGNNTLCYPKDNAQINPFHAYFELESSTPGASGVKAIVLNFGDDTNSIQTISNETNSNDGYYTIDGRRLNEKPATAGLYIINGKKVIIK